MHKGYGKNAGGCAKGAGKMKPQMMAQSIYEAAPAAPSFIGGAARKRRLELAREAGMLPPLPGVNQVQLIRPAQGAATPAAKKAQPAAQAAAPRNAGVGVKWIQVAEDSSLVLEKGLPELAPALVHCEELKTLLSASTLLLYDIAGESAGEIELIHDADWTLFPDVAEAVKNAAGEEQPVCVAISPDQGKWGVGAAGNWKKREQAARLALCVAMAANVEDFTRLAQQQPEFTMFCENSGIATDTNIAQELGAPPVKMAKKAAAVVDDGDFVTKAQKKALAAAAWEAQNGGVIGGKLPRDKPLWIVVEEALPDALATMMPEAVAVVTDGTTRKGLYSSGERALALLLENPGAVEYHDDTNWTTFGPSVGNALKQLAPEEICMCVASCAEKEIWAVGLCSKGKSRWQAAKTAMACALAIKASEEGTEVDLSQEPAIAEFVEEAKAARA